MLCHLFILGFLALCGGVFGPFDIHFNRVSYIIGIFLYKLSYFVCVKILAVLFAVGILLYMHYDIGTAGLLFALFDGVPVAALAAPFKGSTAVILFGYDRDLVRHHESGIKAYAELTYYIGCFIAAFVVLHLLLEGK